MAMVDLVVDKQRSGAARKGVPAGFKLTEVGVIPEDWECVPLMSVGETFIGLTYSPNDVKDFGTLVLRSSNIQDGQLAFEDNVYVQMQLPNRVITKSGDILICVRNGSRQLIGKCALIDARTAGSAFGAFMSLYRSPLAPYVFYQLQSNLVQRQIAETLGATINQITNKDLSNFKIAVPRNKDEYIEISDKLASIDGLIIDLKKIVNKKQAIKTATMQQLLTGKTRLPQFALREDGTVKGYKKSELGEIPEDWSIENFSTLATLRNERINPRTKDIECLCIELEHIISEYGQLNGFTETSGTSSIKNVFSPNDILFGKLRSYLKKYWKATQSGVCSTEIWVLKTELHKAIPEFIFQTVKTDRFVQTASEAYGTHMPRADWKIIKELQVATPSIEEQIAIATILSDMDKEIQTLHQRLDKTRQLKQGMMQELLTGKTRLI
ncbi:restriction endonuclease subunit S [Edwardsiella ictaluri]|nr:restriction endonuclease subunit S [Edwardsiella ictaluri]UCQ47425.1 restriction endonuclease subunit S [Edwardsiella ictaluri]UCQ50689.1 restriction endonuclease subunit S [Edwardsiella ictaluri]WFO08790.1 restriction endonuclease subunit S [Edwardsiella ictaluri]WFO11708.1 restriction endonuclease subunit S [Edwardsiella ictaluri]STP84887.1 Type I restriction enzyme EcoKI specificity protein [Edwardsiella ictaluri]